MPKNRIYTVGHSNHPAAHFLGLLNSCQVNCVVDVRSIPASRYNPQYHQGVLAPFLKENEILYLHFGREFGARHTNTALHDADGRVDFEKVRATSAFRQGITRLEEGVRQGFVAALMCAETDPLDCHRFSMIAVALQGAGWEVLHILKDGSVVSHGELEQELLRRFAKKLPQPTLFEPGINRQDQLQTAYRLHNQSIGWSEKADDDRGI